VSSEQAVQHYADLIDELFCRPTGEFAGYQRLGPPEVVVPGVMARAPLLPPDDVNSCELTIFEGIDGFAGELWERSARTMLRMRPLRHAGLPEIAAAKFLPGRGMGFTLTRDPGAPMKLDEAAAWAAANPLEAFEQFSVLLDALRQLHGARIMHRGLMPGAFRYHAVGDVGPVRLSLARFEMSALISNVIRRVAGSDVAEVREIVRALYLTPDPGAASGPPGSPLDLARHLAYLAPEMHPYLLDEQAQSRRDWEGTDTFGLGVLGWELFCGALPRVLPDELGAVAATEGPARIRALSELNHAMRRHLDTRAAVPDGLRAALRHMIDPKPEGRETSFELATRIEQGWDGIHDAWEVPAERPYLVAFMPEESVETIYNQRGWISRSPEDPAGQELLRAFFVKELRQASLVHSRTGAYGYATGTNSSLREAEWVLIGEQALWFCSFLRMYRMGGEVEKIIPEVLVIKYLKEHGFASELSGAYPRRRLPELELVPFRPRQPLTFSHEGHPSWEKLTESVRSRGSRDEQDERFLQSVDFLLDYQRMVLDARIYPFTLDNAGPGASTLLRFDESRDAAWRHRSPLFTAYVSDARRRPKMGDFFRSLAHDADLADTGPESDPEWIMVDIDPRPDQPAFGRDAPVAQFIVRRDADTIEVRPRSGGKLPARGWLRPHSDSGSPPHLARQIRARQALQNQPATIRSLRDPVSYEISRGHWPVADLDLDGNAPDVIRDMLALEPFYALQGPPGSGKTTAASHALAMFLAANRGARVLVSAQSNFALDNLAGRLIKTLPPGTLVLREVPEGRPDNSVSDDIQPFTADRLTEALAQDVEKALAGLAPEVAADPAVGSDGRPPPGEAASAPPNGTPRAAELTEEERRLAEAQLASEWLASIRNNQVELGERVRSAASVVLATCSISATVFDGARRLDESFDWVIVEEAAKAWPTEVVIPLVLGTRWTLIGDHRQLGAHRGEAVAAFLDSLRSYPNEDVRVHYDAREDRLRVLNLFKSLFEEPASSGTGTLADAATAGRAVTSSEALFAKGRGRLTMQFRMHRDIAEPVSRVFYPKDPPVLDADGLAQSFLQSHPRATTGHGVTHPSILAGAALVWLDTAGHPACTDHPMWTNDGEVDLVEALVASMRPPPTPVGSDEDQNSLVVLTPYRAQAAKLRQRGELRGRVHTVHSFQGREADRVVVSLVRSTDVDGGPASNVGHVGQDEVANVLLSRAVRLLVVVGNFAHFAANGGPRWRDITTVIRRYGRVVSALDWQKS
jgi:AAA domain